MITYVNFKDKNDTNVFVIKDNDVETYLCNECFYMYESPEGSQAFCISQI